MFIRNALQGHGRVCRRAYRQVPFAGVQCIQKCRKNEITYHMASIEKEGSCLSNLRHPMPVKAQARCGWHEVLEFNLFA